MLTDAASGAILVNFEPKVFWAWGGALGVSRGITDLKKNVAYELSNYLRQSRGIALPTLAN